MYAHVRQRWLVDGCVLTKTCSANSKDEQESVEGSKNRHMIGEKKGKQHSKRGTDE